MAKGQLVHLPVATSMSVEIGVHGKSSPILDKLEDGGDTERPSFSEEEEPHGRNHRVEATGTTIV
jgi:hypothetical protein